jgi:hypothetical protein
MKPSKSLIAAAVVALLPLAAIAGDQAPAPMATTISALVVALDTTQDGRISRVEASNDSKLVFATADVNGDGYLDASEYVQRDTSMDSKSSQPEGSQSGVPDTDAPKPRQ